MRPRHKAQAGAREFRDMLVRKPLKNGSLTSKMLPTTVATCESSKILLTALRHCCPGEGKPDSRIFCFLAVRVASSPDPVLG